MATLLHSEPRRLCSWLWDSHVCPKNSKWLQENLTEMDAKVRAMLKIINEDADSFARRAEMYYKKRPELMKLVEDFYRAYRVLAERYDHVTGELRLAHKTMPEAFPNQVHSMLRDDHMPSTSEPHLPASISPHLVRAFFYPDESDFGLSRKGLKQLVEMFQTGDERLRDKDSISEQCSCLSSDENQSCIAETVMQSLKEALVKMEAERDAVLVEYRQSLEKISNLEKELDSAQNDVKELRKHANEAQGEAIALKESFEKLEAEQDSSLDHYNLASQKLVSLEASMVTIQEETTKWSDQAVKAETECRSLKLELSLYEDEKQDALHLYAWSLEKISVVEEKLLVAEENAKQLYEQIDLAETEIKVLKEELSRLTKEKDDACFRHHQCLDAISKLRNELMETKEDIRRLNSEILSGSKKLTAAEDRCSQLEKMNQLLRNEVKDLVQKIAERDQELFQNQTELEELMNRLQVEQSRFVQVEATLDSLQNLHFQSQEEQRALTLKLSNGLQMLKDLESCKLDLELEIQSLREENQELNDHKSAFFVVKRDMENKVLSLKEIKEKLDSKVRRQADKNDAFERQVHQMNKETEVLNKKYKDILQQVESAGIDSKHVRSSIEELRHKNSRLKEISREEKAEKEALLKKLEDMEEKSSILESYLSDVHIELESAKGRMKAMQETCDSLSGEKLALVAEKSALLFKIQVFTESIQNLLKKNVSLEDSLFNANTELEGLREKLNTLEDLECENMMQHLEIASLREANECLDTEVDLLNEELEACKCREVILNSELNEGSCDLEIWEDVAVSYYCDLHSSTVREALFESKVHELSGLCNILEDLNVRRSIEIERMKDKISFLESKNKGLETQLAAYVPVILSLKNNIASLVQNLVSHTKVHLTGTSKEQGFTVNDIRERHPPNADDKSSSVLDGLSELQDFQSQIQTIENIQIAERFSIQKYMNADIEHVTKMKEIEELNSRINLQPHQIIRDAEFSWSAPGTRDIMDETHAKEILLHQMLEFAENTDLKATELNEVGNGKIILERLSSDAQELERLNLSVQELKRKIKTNKKCNSNSNSTKVLEYKGLSGQLQDIEDSIVHLVDVNNKLIKTIKESSSLISVDSVELAKARKEAEKIGRLQLDVQKIQYLLVKLEDDKTENKKGKSRSLRSQTGVNLSDFLYSHGRRNRKQRKVHMCGCDSADVFDPCITKFVKLDTKFTSMPNTVNFLSPLKR